MGYTHYWGFRNNPKDIKNGAEKFKTAVSLFKKGLKHLPKRTTYDGEEIPLKLFGGMGNGKPIIRDTEICFNGDAKKHLDYETCIIKLDNPTDYSYDFCKTARMPYDVAVCLALLCFKKAFGEDFAYSSDGNIESGEGGWAKAKEIIKEL